MKSGELIAIGGAYIDITVPNFPLESTGLQLETEVVGSEYIIEPGGSAVNFARLCGALDMPVRFIGKVGKDTFGTTLADFLRRDHVQPALVVGEDVSTNVGFNMVNQDGKSIMAVAGTANQSLAVDEVYTAATERLASGSYLYIGGCFKLKKLLPAFERLMQDAKTANVPVVLDHGRVTNDIADSDKEIVRKLALRTDIYLPSADEFMKLWGVSSIEAGLRLLKHKGHAGVTIVKNSDKGALVLIDDRVVTVPSFAVTPIHTIGAGDTFNAGFIAAQYKGTNLLDSIRFGCATAALKISQKTLPVYADVQNFMVNHE
jgi:sugar/nucleoside kinase (ribokinase family)